MSYFDIHWKGRPHHHVPRIRVAHRRPFRSRSLIQQSDNRAARKPFYDPINSKGGKFHFGIRFRRRKTRSSQSAAARARDRQRASSKARQNIQVYGWDSAAAEVASITTRSRAGCSCTIRSKTRQKTSITYQLSPRATSTTVCPLTDGAASSTSYNRRLIGTKNVNHPYTFRSPKPVKLSPPRGAHKQQRRTAQRTISLNRRSDITQKSSYDHPKPSSRGSVCDSKVDSERYFANTIKREQKRDSIVSGRIFKKSQTNGIISSSKLGDAPDLTVTQVSGCGCGDLETATISSVLTSLLSDRVSRTSSQRRALEKFSQELKFYLQVAEAFPKPNSASSRAATIISANTIVALKPYWKEFQSAGLAVTSNEQKGMAFKQSSKSRKVSTPPLMNVEENGGESGLRRGNLTTDCSIDRDCPLSTNTRPKQSLMSGSTGTTIIGFTPPHEKSYGSSKMPISRRGFASDHTVIGFNPSQEIDMQALSPISKPSTKKRLPWLRNQAPQSDAQLDRNWSSQKTILKDDVLRDMILPLSPQEPLSLDEIIGSSSRKDTDNTFEASDQSRISHFLSDLRSRGSNTGKKGSGTIKADDVAGSGGFAVQPQKSTNLRGNRHRYSDIGTQTHYSNGINIIGTDTEHHIITSRAPLPTCPNETFPSIAIKYPEVCSSTTQHSLAVESNLKPRLSKVHWKRANEAVQIDEFESGPLSGPQAGGNTRSILLSPELNEHDRPSATPNNSDKVLWKPLTSSTAKYPQGESSTIGKNVLSSRHDPTRYPPALLAQCYPVPRCTQCDRETEGATRIPNPGLQFESEYEIRLVAKGYPTHRCRTRSSIDCQQCLPSRPESAAVSPLEVSMPFLQPKSAALARSSDVSTRSKARLGSHSLVTGTHSGSLKQSSTGAGQNPLIPEPVKRPTLPMLDTLHVPKPRTQSHTKSALDAVSLLCAKALPQIPQPQLITSQSLPLESQKSGAVSVDTWHCSKATSSQKLALKGLQVATAAACDEDVNMWVQETTGLSVRQFLADLGKFECLSDGNGSNTAARHKGKNVTD